MKTYSELKELKTFEERFNYLKLLDGHVAEDTFGSRRYLNQQFYQSQEWKSIRRSIILRDLGCDLGIEGYELSKGRIYIHHMNPLSIDDFYEVSDFLKNPEYLICCSFDTHNAIHYGSKPIALMKVTERYANDMAPWRSK